jgi:hypothetical protein
VPIARLIIACRTWRHFRVDPPGRGTHVASAVTGLRERERKTKPLAQPGDFDPFGGDGVLTSPAAECEHPAHRDLSLAIQTRKWHDRSGERTETKSPLVVRSALLLRPAIGHHETSSMAGRFLDRRAGGTLRRVKT